MDFVLLAGGRGLLGVLELAELVLDQVAEGQPVVLAFDIALIVLLLEVRLGLPEAQRDLLVPGVQLDDLGRLLFADLDDVGRILDFFLVDLGVEDDALDAAKDFDEDAEIGDPDDLDVDEVADLLAAEKVFPDIALELLDPQRDLLLLDVDVEEDGFDLFPDLELGRGVLDLLPGDVRDMDETFDPRLDFEERAEIGDRP
jgi:hypothetical protein